jgi:nitronate monooxygenase
MVITSVGSPAPVIGPLHDAGALVFADVASIRHAERAVAAGRDGLVLLTAGAGGRPAGSIPFVFVRAVRALLRRAAGAGGRHRRRPRAARRAGARLRPRLYGHKIHRHAREHGGSQDTRQLLVTSSADDILLTTAFTGLQTNMLRPSIEAAGLDPDNLPLRGAIDIGKDIDVRSPREPSKALEGYLERGALRLGCDGPVVRRRDGRAHAWRNIGKHPTRIKLG